MTDDLIGRAEAQTAIQFAAKRYTVAHEAHGEGQVVWSDNLINVTDAMNVLRDLPSAQPEQQWIPVSARLPEEGEVVLTQAKFKDDVKMAVSSRIDYNYWTTWGTRDINIIAWMPLPEPYCRIDSRAEGLCRRT